MSLAGVLLAPGPVLRDGVSAPVPPAGTLRSRTGPVWTITGPGTSRDSGANQGEHVLDPLQIDPADVTSTDTLGSPTEDVLSLRPSDRSVGTMAADPRPDSALAIADVGRVVENISMALYRALLPLGTARCALSTRPPTSIVGRGSDGARRDDVGRVSSRSCGAGNERRSSPEWWSVSPPTLG